VRLDDAVGRGGGGAAAAANDSCPPGDRTDSGHTASAYLPSPPPALSVAGDYMQ